MCVYAGNFECIDNKLGNYLILYTHSVIYLYLSPVSVVVDAMYEVMLIILNINDKRKENFYQYALAT